MSVWSLGARAVRKKKRDRFLLCAVGYSLCDGAQRSQAGGQADGRANPKDEALRKVHMPPSPFPPVLVGKCQIRRSSRRKDLGWHGFPPGQCDAERIGTVASNLLLILLGQIAAAAADGDGDGDYEHGDYD